MMGFQGGSGLQVAFGSVSGRFTRNVVLTTKKKWRRDVN